MAYLHWCKANNFESMLPSNAQARWLAAVSANAEQGTLDDHVREVAPTEHVVPYSHKLFCEAVVEWLITTNQVSSLRAQSTTTDMVSVHTSCRTAELQKDDWHCISCYQRDYCPWPSCDPTWNHGLVQDTDDPSKDSTQCKLFVLRITNIW